MGNMQVERLLLIIVSWTFQCLVTGYEGLKKMTQSLSRRETDLVASVSEVRPGWQCMSQMILVF